MRCRRLYIERLHFHPNPYASADRVECKFSDCHGNGWRVKTVSGNCRVASTEVAAHVALLPSLRRFRNPFGRLLDVANWRAAAVIFMCKQPEMECRRFLTSAGPRRPAADFLSAGIVFRKAAIITRACTLARPQLILRLSHLAIIAHAEPVRFCAERFIPPRQRKVFAPQPAVLVTPNEAAT